MDTDAEALAAIQGLNDHEHEGRRLVVSEAKPRLAQTTDSPVAGFNRDISQVPPRSDH